MRFKLPVKREYFSFKIFLEEKYIFFLFLVTPKFLPCKK